MNLQTPHVAHYVHKDYQQLFTPTSLFPLRFVLYMLLFVPVFFFRDFLPANELKYISIAEESLRNNTWFVFYNHGVPYSDKPPLYFWILILSNKIFGYYNSVFIGLFSVLPAIGTMLVMNKWMKMAHVLHHRFTSELLLLTTAMFTGATLILRMDMLMTFFIVMTLFTFYRIYTMRAHPVDSYLLPCYLFLAVFTKGPMGFIIPLIAILGFLFVRKELPRLKHLFTTRQLMLLLTLFLLWFLIVAYEGGAEYLNDLLFKQTVGRGLNSFSHKEPFYFYLLRLPVSLLPWTLLYIVLITKAVRGKMIKGTARQLMFTTIVCTLVILSAISAKIDIYLLPIYPFTAYLCGSFLYRLEREKSRWIKASVIVPAIVYMMILPVGLIVQNKMPFLYDNITAVYVAAIILLLSGMMGIGLLWKTRVVYAVNTLSIGLLLSLFSASFAIPQFNKYFGFGTMALEAEKCATEDGCSDYAFYKFSTAENMDVYLKQDLTKLESMQDLIELTNSDKKFVLFVRETEIRREEEFRQWLEGRKVLWQSRRYRIYIVN